MTYTASDLVRIARRDNNRKRPYLVINPRQAKHMPGSPGRALEMFDALAERIEERYRGERLLIVGFAETATAIGAAAAIRLKTSYIQTTREDMPGVSFFVFYEEHSHAVTQKLSRDDLSGLIGDIDRIVFVDDEVTTGKTIRNIIACLENAYGNRLRFAAASVLNGMGEEDMAIFREKAIDLVYLLKTDSSAYASIAEGYEGDGLFLPPDKTEALPDIALEIGGYQNARRLVFADAYERAAEELCRSVRRAIGPIRGENVLVLSTEECVFPALRLGKELEDAGNRVISHSTTRSPILPCKAPGYPLYSRCELASLYDGRRKTFLYNLESYERVFIVTDAPKSETEGLYTLLNALRKQKNDAVILVRWIKGHE